MQRRGKTFTRMVVTERGRRHEAEKKIMQFSSCNCSNENWFRQFGPTMQSPLGFLYFECPHTTFSLTDNDTISARIIYSFVTYFVMWIVREGLVRWYYSNIEQHGRCSPIVNNISYQNTWSICPYLPKIMILSHLNYLISEIGIRSGHP